MLNRAVNWCFQTSNMLRSKDGGVILHLPGLPVYTERESQCRLVHSLTVPTLTPTAPLLTFIMFCSGWWTTKPNKIFSRTPAGPQGFQASLCGWIQRIHPWTAAARLQVQPWIPGWAFQVIITAISDVSREFSPPTPQTHTQSVRQG